MASLVKAFPRTNTREVISFSRPLYRFSVKQYQRMIETGVLTGNDRVELLDGWIVSKMTQKPPHAVTVDLTQALLRAALPQEWHIREQKPVTLRKSQPEPDLAVVRGPARRYARRHPRPIDIALLIEVSDTSLADDRIYKFRLYAQAGIECYWIANLASSSVEVDSLPKGGKSPTYQHRREFGIAESVPLVIEGMEIAKIPVRELLP